MCSLCDLMVEEVYRELESTSENTKRALALAEALEKFESSKSSGDAPLLKNVLAEMDEHSMPYDAGLVRFLFS